MKPRQPQRGSLMVMFALMLLTLLGCVGMALDLAQVYARKAELQQLADAVALAAAGALDGSAAGVTTALARARSTAAGYRYRYTLDVNWSDQALRFGADPDAPDTAWQGAAAAGGAPSGLLFARVDTNRLDDPAPGLVELGFMRALGAGQGMVSVAARAVAGRGGLRLTPLGVCALSPSATAPRTHNAGTVELVEHGFRRGVVYNLLRLNPNGGNGLYFLLDPLDAPDTPVNPANLAPARLAPFFCSGSMALPRIGAGRIGATGLAASSAAPFALAEQLNARFDQGFDYACRPGGAPPDANIKAYSAASATWMTPVPSGPSAEERPNPNPYGAGTSLSTLAERLPAAMAAGDTAAGYGPLWSYTQAVRYAPGIAPGGAYTAFARADWSVLYPVYGAGARPSASATLAFGGMYGITSGPWLQAPAHSPALRQRRVLNLPLLDCPAGTGTGASQLVTVRGIGRFFMTMPASGTVLNAEFAGLAAEQSLGNRVELYQ